MGVADLGGPEFEAGMEGRLRDEFPGRRDESERGGLQQRVVGGAGL